MGFGLMAVRGVVGFGFRPVGFVAARGLANQAKAQAKGEIPDKEAFVAQQLIKEGEGLEFSV